MLRAVYHPWFERLLAVAGPGERVLEMGAGPGLLAAHARRHRPDLRWFGADLIAGPWNDLAADALRLPVRDGALDAILCLDLIHHLARPIEFLSEAARVLRPGGRLAAMEPWVTPLSFPIYRWLHQEGCRPGLDPRDPFGSRFGGGKPAFLGDAAIVWRLLRATPSAEWPRMGFGLPSVELWNGFAYLSTLGFRRSSLLPRCGLRPLLWLDRWCRPAAGVLGLRALVVWKRLPPKGPAP